MGPNEIYVSYGNTPKAMVAELLAEIRPEDEVGQDAVIGLKPNLVVAKPAGSGATTSPDLVAGVIEYFLAKEFRNICILEGSWVGQKTDQAFRVCGYQELARRYQIPLIDLQKDGWREYESGGMKINICNQVMALDYLINIPVLKGHCQTKMTCALKNMKGCIPDAEKRRFHTLGLHQPIAVLNQIVQQNLIIVDGLNGDLNFEEGGNPVAMNRVIAGKDPVLVDSFAAKLMGYSPEEIPYLGMAARLGVGNGNLAQAEIKEFHGDHQPGLPVRSPEIQRLAKQIVAREACSACYGSLIHALARLSERNLLPDQKFYIGQGFQGHKGQGIGIGSCARGFAASVAGCPPTAKDIVDFVCKK